MAYLSTSYPYCLTAFTTNFYSAYLNGNNDSGSIVLGIGNVIGFMGTIHLVLSENIDPQYLKIVGGASLVALPYLEKLAARIFAAGIISGSSIFLGAFYTSKSAQNQILENPNRTDTPSNQSINTRLDQRIIKETHDAFSLGLFLIFMSAITGYICGRVMHSLSQAGES